jgi:hypothetical protein
MFVSSHDSVRFRLLGPGPCGGPGWWGVDEPLHSFDFRGIFRLDEFPALSQIRTLLDFTTDTLRVKDLARTKPGLRAVERRPLC